MVITQERSYHGTRRPSSPGISCPASSTVRFRVKVHTDFQTCATPTAGPVSAAVEGSPDMPAEHRRPVAAAARTQPADLAAVLPQPTPQRGLARRGQRMSTHADPPGHRRPPAPRRARRRNRRPDGASHRPRRSPAGTAHRPGPPPAGPAMRRTRRQPPQLTLRPARPGLSRPAARTGQARSHPLLRARPTTSAA